MAKYKFRLATLQKVREARCDQQRAELAEALRAEQLLADRRAELLAEQQELLQLQRESSGAHFLNVNRLLDAQRYELVLKAREVELTQQQAAVAAEAERRRLALVESTRDVRVLELLDDRQRREYEKELQHTEARQLDEVAVQRYQAPRSDTTW